MFGLMFFCLGVLGQYIAQIYEEVKARPNYIVSGVVGFESTQVDALQGRTNSTGGMTDERTM
jgi:hypothetical protein